MPPALTRVTSQLSISQLAALRKFVVRNVTRLRQSYLPSRIDLSTTGADTDRTAFRCMTRVIPSKEDAAAHPGYLVLKIDNNKNEKVFVKIPPGQGMRSKAVGDSFEVQAKVEAHANADSQGDQTLKARVGSTVNHSKGTKLLVLHEKSLVDVTVLRKRGPTYFLKLVGNGLLSKSLPEKQLNSFNHCEQLFDNVDKFMDACHSYCKHMEERWQCFEDAITGNNVDLEKNAIEINTSATSKVGGEGGSAGLSLEGYEEVKTMRKLTPLLLQNSPGREQGTLSEQDVLIRAEPGTGKTCSIQQLALDLAKESAEKIRKWHVEVPLIPLLVHIAELTALLIKHGEPAMVRKQNSFDFLRFYIEKAELSSDAEAASSFRKLLLQAYELKAIVPLIDGLDEGADFKVRIEDFVVDRLAPAGLRVVLTSRPEGVQLHRYKDAYVIMNLKALNVDQQNAMIKGQLNDKQTKFFFNLSETCKIRTRHDEIYLNEFTVADRKKIDDQTKYAFNTFVKKTKEGTKTKERDPRRRQHSHPKDGKDKFIRVNSDAFEVTADGGVKLTPQSKTLQELHEYFTRTPNLMETLDEVCTAVSYEGRKFEEVFFEKLYAPKERPDEKDDGKRPKVPEKHTSVTKKLCELAIKNAQDAHDKEAEDKCKTLSPSTEAAEKRYAQLKQSCACKTASTLWPLVVKRTDHLYIATEDLLPKFGPAMEALKAKLGKDAEGVELKLADALKDPVRVHEKAMDDYVHDFGDWHDDVVIPEACVLDVMRGRAICSTTKSMLSLQKMLMRDRGVVLNDGSAGEERMIIVSARNKVKFTAASGDLDPMHFRNILNNLEWQVGPPGKERCVFVELQIHHGAIYKWNDESHAHDFYDYFRSMLANTYQEDLDGALEAFLDMYNEAAGVPVLLSMLVLIFSDGNMTDLPRSRLELYEKATKVAVTQRLAPEKRKKTEHKTEDLESPTRSPSIINRALSLVPASARRRSSLLKSKPFTPIETADAPVDTKQEAQQPQRPVDSSRNSGVLKILLKSGVGLKGADFNGKSDPYVKLFSGEQEAKSKTIKSTPEPSWNEELTMSGTLQKFLSSGLLLKVFDSDSAIKMSQDNHLGDVQVSLEQLKYTDTHEFSEAMSTQGNLEFTVSWARLTPVEEVLRMLTLVAVEAHKEKQREFDHGLVKRALEDTDLLTLWDKLKEEDAKLPLFKCIGDGSKYQAKHLSFQEGIFATALAKQDAKLPLKLLEQWFDVDKLGDEWFFNAFKIGGRKLGNLLSDELSKRTDKRLTFSDSKELKLMGEWSMAALLALDWGLLRHLDKLEALEIPRGCAIPLASMRMLGDLLLLKDEATLGALHQLKLHTDCPAAFDPEAAKHLAQVVETREKSKSKILLALHTDSDPKNRSGLKDADAVLIAASLRSVLSGGAVPLARRKVSKWEQVYPGKKVLVALEARLEKEWASSATMLNGTDVMVKQTKDANKVPLQEPQLVKLVDVLGASGLKDVDDETVGHLRQCGLSLSQLKDAGISMKQLNTSAGTVGTTKTLIENLKSAGFNNAQLKEGFSAKELRDAAGSSALDLKKAGFPAAELRDAGFDVDVLLDAGFTPSELKAAGFSAADLKTGLVAQRKSESEIAVELKKAGFDAAELRLVKLGVDALRSAGFTKEDLGITDAAPIFGGGSPARKPDPPAPKPGADSPALSRARSALQRAEAGAPDPSTTRNSFSKKNSPTNLTRLLGGRPSMRDGRPRVPSSESDGGSGTFVGGGEQGASVLEPFEMDQPMSPRSQEEDDVRQQLLYDAACTVFGSDAPEGRAGTMHEEDLGLPVAAINNELIERILRSKLSTVATLNEESIERILKQQLSPFELKEMLVNVDPHKFRKGVDLDRDTIDFQAFKRFCDLLAKRQQRMTDEDKMAVRLYDAALTIYDRNIIAKRNVTQDELGTELQNAFEQFAQHGCVTEDDLYEIVYSFAEGAAEEDIEAAVHNAEVRDPDAITYAETVQVVMAFYETNTIYTERLEGIMRALGHAPTRTELEDMIEAIDQDGNGKIDLDEFRQFCKLIAERKGIQDELKKELERAFEQFAFGADDEKCITEDDLASILSVFAEGATDEDIDWALRNAEVRDADAITYTETVQVVMAYHKKFNQTSEEGSVEPESSLSI